VDVRSSPEKLVVLFASDAYDHTIAERLRSAARAAGAPSSSSGAIAISGTPSPMRAPPIAR